MKLDPVKSLEESTRWFASNIPIWSALGLLMITLLICTTPSSASTTKTAPQKDQKTEAVWISRPDGALSCSAELGQSLSDGEKELKNANIPVIESRKGSDGKMHIQMCGASQGTMNTFLIPKSHLKKAMTLGYQTDTRIK
jgi:hypothetical protein